MKQLIKSLIREYFDDYEDLGGFEDFLQPSASMGSEKFKKELNALPEVITLYRILVADSVESIDTRFPGSHYSMDKKNLLRNHSFLKNNKYFLMTVEAPKKMIDMGTTIQNNINFPTEKEITLKNKGKGSRIVGIDPLN